MDWFNDLMDWLSGLFVIYNYTTADGAEDAEDSEENIEVAWCQAQIDCRDLRKTKTLLFELRR